VISINYHAVTQKYITKFSQDFHNRKKFLLNGGVIELSLVKLAGVEGKWFIVLRDDSSKLHWDASLGLCCICFVKGFLVF
jgi:hypothetical protein